MAQPSAQTKDKQLNDTTYPKAPPEIEDRVQPATNDKGSSAERDIDVQVSWLLAVVCH